MLVTEPKQYSRTHSEVFAERRLPQTELEFYRTYDWCLNPYPTVGQAIDHLRDEIDRLQIVTKGWQAAEIANNIFLLACAVLNSVAEYLCGPTLRMPSPIAARRLARGSKWVTQAVASAMQPRRHAQTRRWYELWQNSLADFLPVLIAGTAFDPATVAKSAQGLAMAAQPLPLPPELAAEHVGVPSPFRRLDLTPIDVLTLGQQYAARFPDRSQPICLIGLRTSGSYFAPLLAAYFAGDGYRTVSWLTIQAQKGPGRRERQELRRCARQGCMALIVDDPPHTAGTILLAIDIARRVGFGGDRVKVLAPTHAARPDWFSSLPDGLAVTLAPEQWHVRRLLDPRAIEKHLAEYFPTFISVRVVRSARADEFSAHLQKLSHGGRGSRCKQVYAVRLETPLGRTETRYVLAKSVGWGWLGYHAFLAGHRLSGFVPPILGLRDGILYSEWASPRPLADNGGENREERIERSASYVISRVRRLNLLTTPGSGKGLTRDCNGVRLLAKVLSKAYGRIGSDVLARPHLERRLSRQSCPYPTLIDGKMQRAEWITSAQGLLKTDYEHHGLGKAALNIVDPAYDLAEIILDLALSSEEESRLIRRYAMESGDDGVEQRLFLHKLLAGVWAMDAAQQQLFGKPQARDRQQECHQHYMRAWNFLTTHAARYCGSYCGAPAEPQWCAPLVALDIDGVLDRRLFGFPCTTAAGIEALSLLRAHRISVALNTARSVAEVKAYCDAYSLVGGVAEHGSYLWDAVAQQGRVLVSAEAMRQLDELRRSLERLPGVFLDTRHQYSIRAFTYHQKPSSGGLLPSLLNSVRPLTIGDGALAPLPPLMVQHLITDLGLDRLSFHQTRIDTTIIAKGVDKGLGLSALRDWVLEPNAATIAVGDSEHDLSMFRVATRSYAPAHIDCARQARLLGCEIALHPYQRGLRDIARLVVHSNERDCAHCTEAAVAWRHKQELFPQILRAADRHPAVNLLGVLTDPAALRVLLY
jgi:hydroxymethylpyrimidine pyrophosphatase-like HAD family hydrolase